MLKRISIIVVFLLLIGTIYGCNEVSATPGNSAFKDDFFYQAIINQLNGNNILNNQNRTIDYNVTDIELKSITSITCGSMEEPIIDMSGLEKLPNLSYLCIEYPKIFELDISKNPELKYIRVLNANDLHEIDFSHNTKLESIDLTYTHLKQLNVSNCPNLTYISMGAGSASDALIEELDLSI